jgi:hypothetical protein
MWKLCQILLQFEILSNRFSTVFQICSVKVENLRFEVGSDRSSLPSKFYFTRVKNTPNKSGIGDLYIAGIKMAHANRQEYVRLGGADIGPNKPMLAMCHPDRVVVYSAPSM